MAMGVLGQGVTSVTRGSWTFLPQLCKPKRCMIKDAGKPFSSFYIIGFCFVRLPVQESFNQRPVLLPLFLIFLQPYLIHSRMTEGSLTFVHGRTFLHQWSGQMKLVVGQLHSYPILGPFHTRLFIVKA